MPIIIDGHNLIPKIPGLNLSDMDDEIQLIQMLQEYARIRRKQVEVYFDNALTGQPRVRTYGTVVVKFSRPGYTADEEIRGRLSRLGKEARNWMVVSSDQRVLVYARGARAQLISAEEFVRDVQAVLAQVSLEKGSIPEQGLNSEEVNMWLEIFEEKERQKHRKIE